MRHDLQDAPALALGADMVPEERGAGVGVRGDAVEQVGGVFVEAVVDDYGHVLYSIVSVFSISVCDFMRGV